LEDRRNVGENSCNSGDGTDQRVQSLMFMMMMKYTRITSTFIKRSEQCEGSTEFRSIYVL
jgi:hypothetical protein